MFATRKQCGPWSKRPLPKIYLAEWQEQFGLSDEDLAEQAGTSRGYVFQIKTGKRPYNQRILSRFAAVMGLEAADLFHSPEDHAFIRWFLEQPPAGKETISRVARALIVTEEPPPEKKDKAS